MARRIAFLLLIPTLLAAQGRSVGYGFLKIPVTARSAALAESDLADPLRFSSWTANPALLANKQSVSLMLSHVEWIQDVQTESFALSLPLSFVSVGLSISSTAIKDIEVRDRPGEPLGTFNARGTTLGGSFGVPLDAGLSVGMSLKYIFEKLYVDESQAFGIDIGLLSALPLSGLSAGLTLTNLGASNRMRTHSTDLPAGATLAVAYDGILEPFGLTATAAYSNLLHDNRNRTHFGLETRYDLVSLRAGYQTGYDSRGFSAGFGARYDLMTFDYAFLPFSFGLGNAHLINLSFEF